MYCASPVPKVSSVYGGIDITQKAIATPRCHGYMQTLYCAPHTVLNKTEGPKGHQYCMFECLQWRTQRLS